MVIAIDGPAGAGKSTIAQGIAHALRIVYFDSGAVYRLMTLIVLRDQGQLSVKEDYTAIFREKLSGIALDFSGNERQVYYFNENVTSLLRSEEVTRNINIIANHGPYRDLANNVIRGFAQDHDIVIDGRDIGTVVFPDTPYKFYLDASPELRAMRRFKELQESSAYGTSDVSLEQITQDMIHRDEQDQNRQVAPLRRAEDAIYISSDSLTAAQVIERFLKEIEKIRVRVRS